MPTSLLCTFDFPGSCNYNFALFGFFFLCFYCVSRFGFVLLFFFFFTGLSSPGFSFSYFLGYVHENMFYSLSNEGVFFLFFALSAAMYI